MPFFSFEGQRIHYTEFGGDAAAGRGREGAPRGEARAATAA